MQLVNAGGVPAISEVARLPFTVDGLLSEVRAIEAIDDGGDDDFGAGASASRSRCSCPRSRRRPG